MIGFQGSKGGNINVSYRSFLISARNLIRYISFALDAEKYTIFSKSWYKLT